MNYQDPNVVYALLVAVVATYFIRWYTDPLRSIPTVVGPDAPILSYLGAFKYVRHGKEMLQEGYDKYPGAWFKIAMLDQWLVVASGPKLVDEIRKRPDEELSFLEGIAVFTQTQYTLGWGIHHDPYHIDVIREMFTRGLPALLPDVIDELTLAVEEHIPSRGDEWVSVVCSQKAREIVARASNRVFVGAPACRVPEYLDITINFALNVVRDRVLICLFPDFLKPIVGRIISNVGRSVRRAVPFLAPIIEERQRMLAEYGDDWSERPKDMLQYIIERAPSYDCSAKSLVQRILATNFAAIHTSSNSVTHAIYHLAEKPEFVQALREEIEPIIKEEGWCKTSIAKMWKLDSFLKETQRYEGIGLISLFRKAQKDVTFSDGTFLPKGTVVVVPSHSIHHDEANYAGASVFDPFRFSRMREREGEATKHQFVNTSVEYVAFGHGKHACPGRFFAANELKAMLAYLILHYDMKLPGDGKAPANVYLGHTVLPAPTGEVLFRKRRESS